VKSTFESFESVEHVIGSSPVTVNVKVLLVELPALRRRVTIGARLSAATVVVVVVVVLVVVVVVLVVVVVATVVVVVATGIVVVVVVATVAVFVIATETTVQMYLLPDLAQTNFVLATTTTLPAFTHFAPDRACADTVSGCVPNTPNTPSNKHDATNFLIVSIYQFARIVAQ
jgi:hypothetical protein